MESQALDVNANRGDCNVEFLEHRTPPLSPPSQHLSPGGKSTAGPHMRSDASCALCNAIKFSIWPSWQ
jgi:hypothetical protein